MPKVAKVKPTAKDKLKHNALTNAAGDIFKKIQKKTGVDKKRIDAWQKSWLEMPENRKKYKHLQDAPQVVGEELIAISNDIIDYVQGEGGGQSHVFRKLKEEFGGFVSHPIKYLQKKGEQGKKVVSDQAARFSTMATKVKAQAKKAAK